MSRCRVRARCVTFLRALPVRRAMPLTCRYLVRLLHRNGFQRIDTGKRGCYFPVGPKRLQESQGPRSFGSRSGDAPVPIASRDSGNAATRPQSAHDDTGRRSVDPGPARPGRLGLLFGGSKDRVDNAHIWGRCERLQRSFGPSIHFRVARAHARRGGPTAYDVASSTIGTHRPARASEITTSSISVLRTPVAWSNR